MIRDADTFEALLDSVRRFVRERLVPAENEVADTDEIPPAIVQEMREMGLFGLTIPESYGGLELTMEEESRLLFELCKTSPAFRSVIGTTAIRGTDSEGEHYIVNGTKRYITNAPHSKIFTLMARTNPADKGAGGLSAFIVDAQSPGISLGKNDKKMGQKGVHTCDVMFDNVRVPAANLIGHQEGQGFKTAMKVLEKGRIHLAAVCVGVAQRILKLPDVREKIEAMGLIPGGETPESFARVMKSDADIYGRIIRDAKITLN